MYIIYTFVLKPLYGKIIKDKEVVKEKKKKREYLNTYILLNLLEETKKTKKRIG